MTRRPIVGAVVALLVDLTLFGAAVAVVYRFSSPTRATESPGPTTSADALRGLGPGAVAAFADELGARRKGPSVVLALESDCPICAQEVADYRQFAEAAVAAGLNVFVVGREEVSGLSNWLLSQGIRATKVVRLSDPSGDGFRGAPTCLILDGAGTVTDSWLGAMPPETRLAFLARIRNRSQAAVTNIAVPTLITGLANMKARLAEGGVYLLDIRDREPFNRFHIDGALNIPAQEMEVRAPNELPARASVVVDCSHLRPSGCESASSRLDAAGFRVAAFTY